MTIKAKRAKALPVMPESVDYSIGGMVDQTLTKEAEAILADNADRFADDFGEWYRYQVGIYRILLEDKETSPATHEELRLVQEARQVLREAMKRLGNLPPSADGYINLHTWKRHGRLFHTDFLNDFLTLSDQIQNLLGATEHQLDALPKKAGRKSEADRDRLLLDTAEKLRNSSRNKISEKEVASLTYRLLEASGVKLPKLKQVQELISSKAEK